MRIPAGLDLVMVALICLAEPAQAKGAESGTITGPGIVRSIDVRVRSTDAARRGLVGRLMEQTGPFFASGDLLVRLEEPPGELGPGYTLTWVRSGSPGESLKDRTFRQVVYPEADGGPVIHTPDQRGLRAWGGPWTRGFPRRLQWMLAPAGLRDTLAELGVPIASAPSASGERADDNSVDRFWYVGVVGFALVAVGAVGVRRLYGRPDPVAEPRG